ncbi:MAG: sensor histidine kinase [Bacteroidota bacterium]
MRLLSLIKNYTRFRWILLAAGLLAIIGLTSMNVYSLLSLHKQTVNDNRETEERRLTEFSYEVRERFYMPFRGLSRLNMNRLDESLAMGEPFPSEFTELLVKASTDSLYNDIYFTPRSSTPCKGDGTIYRFNANDQLFEPTNDYSDMICDGLGMARTRMKVLIDDYRWNNKVLFDTHRTMTIALINLHTQSIIGYFTFSVNKDYLINDYMKPLLVKTFGSMKENGAVAWLNDWTRNKILASSDPSVEYRRQDVELVQKFPNLFDDWNLMMAFGENPVISASRTSLIRNLSVLGAAVFLLAGALVFMFVTAQRERELATRQAGFLANVTHELKTPLAVMQAAGENLSDGRVRDPDRLQRYGKHIYTESVRLRSMIDKLLDVAKADAGQTILERSPVRMRDIVQQYLQEHTSYIEGKGFEVETRYSAADDMITVDKDSIQTVLSNLVENAIKYSPESNYIGIFVDANVDRVRLTVEDHGVGIPQKAQKHIFDKFYRVEETLTAHTKGHGLGLSIVQHLVEINQGNIHVESEPGKGSRFIVEFNHTQPAEVSEQQSERETTVPRATPGMVSSSSS